MAIYGKFNANIPRNTIRNMKPRTAAYIFINYFIFSREYLCIHLDTEVFYRIEDVLNLDRGHFIAIYKYKDSNDEKDFDLDLSEDKNFSMSEISIYPGGVTLNYKNSKDYLCFRNPPIVFNEIHSLDVFESQDVYSEIEKDLEETQRLLPYSSRSIEDLKKRLENAVLNEDYEEAARIRDEMKKR